MIQITQTLFERPIMLYCIDEDKTKFHITGEVIDEVMGKLKNEEIRRLNHLPLFVATNENFVDNKEDLKKLKGGWKRKMAWVKYDDNIKQKCLDLIKQGKKIREVVQAVNGPKKKALMRWARSAGISYKD